MSFSIVGDFIIKNETIESKYIFYYWPQPHRLHYKINNQDDLFSFAQIDIIDNDVSRIEQNQIEYSINNWFDLPFRNHMKFTSPHIQHAITFWLRVKIRLEAVWKYSIKHPRTLPI